MNPNVVNPAAFFYDSTQGIEAYSHAGAVIVASFQTLPLPEMQAARVAGALVLLYTDWVEIVQSPKDPITKAYYLKANPWPRLVNGALRVNYPGTVMADIRVGSAWSKVAVQFGITMMQPGSLADGLFNDVAGGRPYSKSTPTQPGADWETWDQDEKDEWTAGCVDIMRQLDEARRRINPRFILINNNVWTGNGPLGELGEQHVNGVCLENHAPDPASATAVYASRPFSGMWPRIMMSITRPPTYTVADAQKWATIPGITHVVFQPNYIGPVPAPAVPCTRTDYSRVLA